MTPDPNSSKKKIAVITGGAGGMGLATAKILGRDHHVTICDINQQRLNSALKELEELGISCSSSVCDVSDRSSVDMLVKTTCESGDVRTVVHTAGISPQMADPETIIRVNALGTINIAEAFFSVAKEGFSLVNVSSVAAHTLPNLIIPTRAYSLGFTDPEALLRKLVFRCRLIPNDFYRRGIAYSLSKNFVMWYSKVSARKFGEKSARILSASPGTFDTEMGRLEEKSGSLELLKDAALKRPGKVEEIAELLAFCASERAGYLTGIDVLCDGGVMAAKVR
jgi:NAD(P)-dependent dehydrogenase (short-subunit alcohol dehydrogenase family)